jgi:hypothetical protein
MWLWSRAYERHDEYRVTQLGQDPMDLEPADRPIPSCVLLFLALCGYL